MMWLHGAFVGQTSDLECTLGIQDRLHMDSAFTIDTVPLGGKLVLLRPWEPGIVARQRLAWLNIVGVPVHACSEVFFR